MIRPPAYFEQIRLRAENRWRQLEEDPEIAGPWHQLFKQVQSPRHVLSELLQNADDAGATEASVKISNGVFSFSHNGEDFTEEHFASLCRFGYSNKRALHTIGFRGIGFKSIFSLGNVVELYSPTLSIAFERNRFTAPLWTGNTNFSSELTEVRVAISDSHRLREIEKNLDEWAESPVSLLFFKHLRRMQIGDQIVHWDSLGPGPVPNTEWMALQSDIDHPFLLARSEPDDFPQEALTEIRQERLLDTEQELDFPPCKVEIVVGATGRLYVVLPTGVETELPFASNAPFIQDPARLKIKDPEISPTNRWLLERIGNLAASTMLTWLNAKCASIADRSMAYDLLSDVDPSDNSLEGSCAEIVENSLAATLGDEPFLLSRDGDLYAANACILAPEVLYSVWPSHPVTKLFDLAGRHPLASEVSENNRRKLMNWKVLHQIERKQICDVLQKHHLPKPQTWRQLLSLWSYLAPEITGYRYGVHPSEIRIVPVQGQDVMYSASEVVRLGEKRVLASDEDWALLARHLQVLNQNWTRFLTEQKRVSAADDDAILGGEIQNAYAVLKSLDLEESSDASDLIEQVARKIFDQDEWPTQQCIQLAQIAAKLGASIGNSFKYVTRDDILRDPTEVILYDSDGTLEELFSPSWRDSHFLHHGYSAETNTCSAEEWHDWLASERSGLVEFVPLVSQFQHFFSRTKLEAEINRRGTFSVPYYPYVTHDFRLEDWGFAPDHKKYWQSAATEDPHIWGRITERILRQPSSFWAKAKTARAMQVATTGSKKSITADQIAPDWILHLRSLPCLRDTRGFYQLPGDLLRRTPETESLIDVEPFVHGHLDTEATRPLLDLLGVRSTPSGPERLLDRLRALAKSSAPPIHEVEKWYRRLDQLTESCSTGDLAAISDAFHSENIIFSDAGEWTNASCVFLSSDEEDVPGAALVRASVRDLMIWRRISIAERPTADLAIEWLAALPSENLLPPEDLRRVKSLLGRHPIRIWNECKHWLNIAGQWAPVGSLAYGITMQSLVAHKHLYDWVKQKTADLQLLSTDITESPPFSSLPALADHIEERFHQAVRTTTPAKHSLWLSQLGNELRRVILEDPVETERVRDLGAALATTRWQIAPGLEMIPYIDGTPAGTPRSAEVVWLDGTLYVEERSPARLAKSIAQELARAFRKQEIGEAIRFCYDRSVEFVSEYMEEYFKLGPALNVQNIQAKDQNSQEQDASQPVPEQPAKPNSGDKSTTEKTPDRLSEILDDPEPESDDTSPNDLEPTPKNDDAVMPKPKPHPPKTDVLERYARAHGFKKDSDYRYYHADGTWLGKTQEARFPWEMRSASGSLLRYLMPKNHCIEKEALQIDAEIWSLLSQSPEQYALVLCDTEGKPIEISGKQLCSMRDSGTIKLFPASYRLVRE